MRILLAMRHVLAILAACLATTAAADERLLKHIDWITERSDNLEYNGEPLPQVKTIPTYYLHVWMYGQDVVDEIEAQENVSFPKIMGVYDHERDTILVPDEFDPYSEWYSPTLLHELVHYLQDINGTMPECAGYSEAEAYYFSNMWIEEIGHERELMDGFTIAMMELMCQEHHGAGGG